MEASNILIAEFMELENPFNENTDTTLYRYKGIDEKGEYQFDIELHEMRYHLSWDWLMPVVDKIESLRDENGNAYRFTIDMGNAQIEGTNIEIVGGSCKLDTTYQAVVEFINWHNEYNQNN
tara:strand:- start:385 stop:747 length:363 start_codon:yes stop_codon:yes gene_type:complete